MCHYHSHCWSEMVQQSGTNLEAGLQLRGVVVPPPAGEAGSPGPGADSQGLPSPPHSGYL